MRITFTSYKLEIFDIVYWASLLNSRLRKSMSIRNSASYSPFEFLNLVFSHFLTFSLDQLTVFPENLFLYFGRF